MVRVVRVVRVIRVVRVVGVFLFAFCHRFSFCVSSITLTNLISGVRRKDKRGRPAPSKRTKRLKTSVKAPNGPKSAVKLPDRPTAGVKGGALGKVRHSKCPNNPKNSD